MTSSLSLYTVCFFVCLFASQGFLHSNICAKFSKALHAIDENDPDLQNFLSGQGSKTWRGTRDILKRRGQVPLPDYNPTEVVKILIKALQSNDDPQLDHGACVVLEFKSPSGPIAESGYNPAEFGNFLRSNQKFSGLVDFKDAKLVGSYQVLRDDRSVKQSVEIRQWEENNPIIYDFYLSKVVDVWLVDAILKHS